MFAVELLIAFVALLFAAPADGPLATRAFRVDRDAEVVLTLRIHCARCDWGAAGREAVSLRIDVDGSYSQHVVASGEMPDERTVLLGRTSAGDHHVTVTRDDGLSAADAGAASVAILSAAAISGDGDEATALAMAPLVYARANTVGRFTDLPILMWYEVVPTARGRQFRYSVIFTNEDGGTATDRLMATWGRTTDIEFVYGAEVDANGQRIAEEFQGPGHEVPAFHGRHEARHPLLWVSTDNNMVSESGSTTIRYALAPERFDLSHASREVVMDRHPWSYRMMAAEMLREHKIDDAATAGSGRIPDQRRFVFVEACTDLKDAALSFGVRARAGGTAGWFDSDRGLAEFRIVRDGCFRGAVPLPADASAPDAVRFQVFSRAPRDGVAAPAPPPVHLTRVNTVFMLDDQYLPTRRLLGRAWEGSAIVSTGAAPFELPLR